MKKENSINFDLMNPEELERKKNSGEGLVYQNELENIGKEIARLQYHLAIWQYRELYKQLRYKEFLGFKLTDVEQEHLFQLEDNLSKFEVETDRKKRDNPRNVAMSEEFE